MAGKVSRLARSEGDLALRTGIPADRVGEVLKRVEMAMMRRGFKKCIMAA